MCFSLVWEFELFFWELGLFREFHKIRKIRAIWGFTVAACRPTANWSSSGEKNCSVYRLFCIFIIIVVIIIVISSSNISISFVALLNCLYLNPQVLPFVHFSSPSLCGRTARGERAAVGS